MCYVSAMKLLQELVIDGCNPKPVLSDRFAVVLKRRNWLCSRLLLHLSSCELGMLGCTTMIEYSPVRWPALQWMRVSNIPEVFHKIIPRATFL